MPFRIPFEYLEGETGLTRNGIKSLAVFDLAEHYSGFVSTWRVRRETLREPKRNLRFVPGIITRAEHSGIQYSLRG